MTEEEVVLMCQDMINKPAFEFRFTDDYAKMQKHMMRYTRLKEIADTGMRVSYVYDKTVLTLIIG
jgi:hypothetical protein